MINTSELMMVNGFTPTMYAVIASTIHALPEITPLNLNTADLQSLLMLSTNSQCQQVADIIQLRAKHGIDNMANVQDLLKKCDIKPSHVTLQSQYFMSVAEVKTGDLQLTNRTLIKRKIDPKGHVKLQVLQSIIN
jgi:general secretion pathway protein K